MATSGEQEESSYMEQLMRLWIPHLIGEAVIDVIVQQLYSCQWKM